MVRLLLHHRRNLRPNNGITTPAGGRTKQTSSDTSRPSPQSSTPSGAEEDPTSFIHRNPVWHFDARSHFRTQSAEDVRRKRRKSRGIGWDDRTVGGGSGDGNDAGGAIFRFMLVCGILIGTVSLPGFLKSPSSRSSSTSSSKSEKVPSGDMR
jgi:hypothetical protein